MPLSTFPTFGRPSNLAAVEHCRIMDQLSPRTRADIANHSFMAYAERDETIWTSGSPSTFVGIVACGHVRLTRGVTKEPNEDLAQVSAGQCFGMEAICGQSAHQANAIAIENTWYLKVPASLFLALLQGAEP